MKQWYVLYVLPCSSKYFEDIMGVHCISKMWWVCNMGILTMWWVFVVSISKVWWASCEYFEGMMGVYDEYCKMWCMSFVSMLRCDGAYYKYFEDKMAVYYKYFRDMMGVYYKYFRDMVGVYCKYFNVVMGVYYMYAKYVMVSIFYIFKLWRMFLMNVATVVFLP